MCAAVRERVHGEEEIGVERESGVEEHGEAVRVHGEEEIGEAVMVHDAEESGQVKRERHGYV